MLLNRHYSEAKNDYLIIKPGSLFTCSDCDFSHIGGKPFNCLNCGADHKKIKEAN